MSGYQLRRNSISQTSRSFSTNGLDTDSLTDLDLVKSVNELKHEIKLLKLENEILENTIKRLEPALMHGVYQALEYATRPERFSTLTSSSGMKSQASKLRIGESILAISRPLLSSPSRISTFPRRGESLGRIGTVIYGAGPKINVLERSELVAIEMEMQEKNIIKVRNIAARQHVYLNCQLEEIEMRVSDIDQSSKMFKQEVLIDGMDKIAQRIPAEIWIRFMREWVKRTDRQIGKLRLRTSTLNAQYSKLKSQIKVKTELSKNLRPVDFEKLSIENGECEKLLDYQLQHLKELKKMTGDANLTLTVHKRAMIEQNSYLNKVIKTRNEKEKQTEEIDKECDKIQLEAENLSQKLDKIRKLRIEYEGMDVMDYVTVKWNVTELKRAIKLLENRAHIQQIALSSVNKQMQTLENDIE